MNLFINNVDAQRYLSEHHDGDCEISQCLHTALQFFYSTPTVYESGVIQLSNFTPLLSPSVRSFYQDCVAKPALPIGALKHARNVARYFWMRRNAWQFATVHLHTHLCAAPLFKFSSSFGLAPMA